MPQCVGHDGIVTKAPNRVGDRLGRRACLFEVGQELAAEIVAIAAPGDARTGDDAFDERGDGVALRHVHLREWRAWPTRCSPTVCASTRPAGGPSPSGCSTCAAVRPRSRAMSL